MFSQL
ncbi:Protein of unknown function [Lactobacillus delbrueckii subsp. bulgaricus]